MTNMKAAGWGAKSTQHVGHVSEVTCSKEHEDELQLSLVVYEDWKAVQKSRKPEGR